MIRICPARDAQCPNGLDCIYEIGDRCLEEFSDPKERLRAFIKYGQSLLSGGAIKIEELSNTKGTGHDQEDR